VCIRCFWKGNHQKYGHIQCIYTVLAKPRGLQRWVGRSRHAPCEVCRVGQNHIYKRCVYGVFGREITKSTALYGVFIRFWPTLEGCKGGLDDRGMHPVRLQRRVGQSPEVICLKEGLTEHASHMRPMHKVYKSAALYLGPVPSAWPCLYHILLFASALLQCNPACSCPLHDLLGLISVVSTEHTLPACSCPLHDLLELISAVSSEHTL